MPINADPNAAASFESCGIKFRARYLTMRQHRAMMESLRNTDDDGAALLAALDLMLMGWERSEPLANIADVLTFDECWRVWGDARKATRLTEEDRKN